MRHVGEGRTSTRPSLPAAGDGDVCVSGRSGASEKGGASKRASHRGRAWRGEAAATTMKEDRRGGDLGENG
jgi:hypothetical protein